jgi:hypothetical protein
LPRYPSAPVKLVAGGRFEFPVFQVPRIFEIAIDFSRAGSVGAERFGLCRRSEIEALDSGEARAACRSAIVGYGSAEIVTRAAEDAPIPVG